VSTEIPLQGPTADLTIQASSPVSPQNSDETTHSFENGKIGSWEGFGISSRSAPASTTYSSSLHPTMNTILATPPRLMPKRVTSPVIPSSVSSSELLASGFAGTKLRKRAHSAGDIGGFIKREDQGADQGKESAVESTLEQIGTPDHSGSMRKKGGLFGSWTAHHFWLKGPYLYCLQSASKEVCLLLIYSLIPPQSRPTFH
jgi:hypothetical protein